MSKKKSRRKGRPASDDPKKTHCFRVEDRRWLRWEKAARKLKMTVSSFIGQAGDALADDILADAAAAPDPPAAPPAAPADDPPAE